MLLLKTTNLKKIELLKIDKEKLNILIPIILSFILFEIALIKGYSDYIPFINLLVDSFTIYSLIFWIFLFSYYSIKKINT